MLNVHSLIKPRNNISLQQTTHWMAFVLLSYGFIYCFNDCLFQQNEKKLHSRFLFSTSFYAFLIKRMKKKNVLRWTTVDFFKWNSQRKKSIVLFDGSDLLLKKRFCRYLKKVQSTKVLLLFLSKTHCNPIMWLSKMYIIGNLFYALLRSPSVYFFPLKFMCAILCLCKFGFMVHILQLCYDSHVQLLLTSQQLSSTWRK